MRSGRDIAVLLVAAAVAVGPIGTHSVLAQDSTVVVGSKLFTEAVILGDIAAETGRSIGAAVEHRRQLGGTRFLWSALLSGDIDLYADYTGTLFQEILQVPPGDDAVRRMGDSLGVLMTEPLGFNNTYALGMAADRAAELGVESISDLVAHPDLVLGFSNEFIDRADGWPKLRTTYGLPQSARGLDHDLAYRGLASGDIDVMDLYSTDAEIAYYGLRVLEDDRAVFPRYDAVYLYRADLAERHPKFVEALRSLAGTLPESRMVALNRSVKLDGVSEREAAATFLRGLGVDVREQSAPSFLARIARRTGEHLVLVGVSLFFAIVVAIPLGVVAARYRRLGTWILGVVGVIYTIPSLALLAFMIPLLGIGGPPAIVALFLYSLLPIVRNTHAGLTDISRVLTESADALGLAARDKLRHIELPLAAPSIIAGIKTSAVINVGTATLGALIGAGGYGQPILTGIRLDDIGLILEGAVPAAVLALLVQSLFDIPAFTRRTA